MRFALGWPALALLPALLACSPAFDWREVRPDGGDLTMLFPCRPEKRERTLALAGAELRMQLHSCEAAGAPFSLAVVDAGEPTRVEPLLAALKASAAANIGGAAVAEPFSPPGATPNPASALLRLQGRLPDGRPVTEHAAFFVRGLRVYQATAIGEALPDDAVKTFFAAIKLAP
ncbi:MAG: hypothetical protein K8R60_01265 [Burkholderiales bacterium]|nr:hypothetical protein [Burkholderiales bacterium]